ncbi:alkylmercury lyase family protein [Alkaliphilus sp. MSJ-5]|nr:alkylmercury lyase family protein [Alkaliphilus flagellatus]
MEENIQFEYYSTEKLMIESIDQRLNQTEKKTRRFLMNYTIDKDKPFNLVRITEDIVRNIGTSEDKFNNLINSLINKRAIVVDKDKNVNFIYPVSALPTNHKVTLSDGRSFYAMCAIDAIGTAFTFKQDINIDSKCSQCGESIYIQIKDGRLLSYIPEDACILHVDLNKHKNWSGDC